MAFIKFSGLQSLACLLACSVRFGFSDTLAASLVEFPALYAHRSGSGGDGGGKERKESVTMADFEASNDCGSYFDAEYGDLDATITPLVSV